ncbi:MAG: hypothetical protein AAGG75_11240 [Bacteroidota bacterium]
MKWLLYISAFCLFSQVVHPCLSGTSCHEEQRAHQEQEKDCATECHCVCCLPVVVYEDIALGKVAPQLHSERASIYISLYTHEFKAAIWQPPRLS